VTFGAVYRPEELTEPNTASHVTAVFVVFVTVDVNCIECPDCNVPEFGDTESPTVPPPPAFPALLVTTTEAVPHALVSAMLIAEIVSII